MKKVIFTNKLYFYCVIVFISILLILNTAQLFKSNLIMIIPLTIQIGLLSLILRKNHYSKIVLKIWLIILLIVSGFQIFLDVFYIIAREIKILSLLLRIVFFVLEMLLLINLKSIKTR